MFQREGTLGNYASAHYIQIRWHKGHYPCHEELVSSLRKLKMNITGIRYQQKSQAKEKKNNEITSNQ